MSIPGTSRPISRAGREYGYLLLWVVLAANLMAMLVQYLSAKLGIVTGRALPELVRDRFPRPVSWGMWIQAEAWRWPPTSPSSSGGARAEPAVRRADAARRADHLRDHLCRLGLRARGRPFELAIIALLGLVIVGFLYETLRLGPSVPASLHGLVPGLDGTGSLYLAAGILGATVMPHAIYLHSALTKYRTPCRDDRDRRRCSGSATGRADRPGPGRTGEHGHAGRRRPRFPHPGASRPDHHRPGPRRTRPPGRRQRGAGVREGAAGLRRSSSSVGTYAGEVSWRASRLPRPAARPAGDHHAPPLAILALGINPTSALVLSQVVLSFGVPFALVPLVMLTSGPGDGRPRQPPPHRRSRRRVRRGDHRPERADAVAAVLPVVTLRGARPHALPL